jgi:RNA polymerase primary sigma factor
VASYPAKTIQKGELLSALFEKAEVQGYLTAEDITELFPWGEQTAEQFTELVAFLRRKGVEVLEESDPPAELPEAPASDLDPLASLERISSDDTIEIYLKEMSRVPLLNLQEEIGLAQRIERGRDSRRELQRLNGNTDPQLRPALESAVEDGLRAREHIIKANTRLVVSIAKRYIGQGVPFLDLIQEGNLGLMKAVEKFEYKRGFRFSTYATWWIRQTITRSIADQGRTIRLPVHMTDRIRRMYRAAHDLEQFLGRPPTAEELAERLKVSLRKVEWMQQVSWVPLSLESPVGEEEDAELGMFIEDRVTPTPAQVVYNTMLRERVDEVLASLTPREARVLRLRFGLDEDRPYTLEEVGAKFGLTRERIRQIEVKALRRLRHPICARRLRDYL